MISLPTPGEGDHCRASGEPQNASMPAGLPGCTARTSVNLLNLLDMDSDPGSSGLGTDSACLY